MRIGLVGLGYWGQNYLRLIGLTGDVNLVAMCDTSPDLVDFASSAAPAAHGTTDPVAVLCSDDVEAIVIATPATTHYELARTALLAGKHVLCEKPLAMTASECEALIDLADASERTLFVGHTFVYNAAVRAAREFVCDDQLGPTLYAQAVWAAPGPVRHDVNALWDLAPHPVSILTYVLQCQPNSVAATGQAILHPDRADIISLHLRFDDTVVADIHLSWLAPKKVRSLAITGARGIAIFDDMAQIDKLRLFDTTQLNGNGAHPSAPQQRTLVLSDEPMHVPQLPAGEPLAAQLAHFLECCRCGSKPESGGRAGTNVVRVLEAAEVSLNDGGRPIDLALEVAHGA